MPEHNRFAHASKNPGRMHGCGHDGHTAMLLGAAQHLAAHRDFDGTVNFIFQPAEEGGNAGARAMIEDGLFERFPCDEIYGMHNMPGFPTGHFGFRKGPTMASSNRFDIIVRGTGGHAAQPHKAVDTIVIAAEMVGVLQTLISRHKNPIDVAVLSVTQIHAGDAYNVLPERGRDPRHRAHLQHRGAGRDRSQHAPRRAKRCRRCTAAPANCSSTAPTRRW